MPKAVVPICHICGYRLEHVCRTDEHTPPDFSICPCCGCEFGYEDATRTAVERYRNDWTRKGCPWFDESQRPADWDREAQLSRVVRLT